MIGGSNVLTTMAASNTKFEEVEDIYKNGPGSKLYR